MSHATNKNNQLQSLLNRLMRPLQIIAFLSCLALCLSITGVGLNPIRPLQLNQGYSTRYMFYINPETSIAANAQVQITFPSEFDQTALASQLSCQASTPSYGWTTFPCTANKGVVTINVGKISNEQLSVLVSQVTNPSTSGTISSSFVVCLMVSNMVTTCSQNFGKVVFPPAPVITSATSMFPLITSLNTLVVGQSSTYQIQFSLSTTYSTGNSIRITFPLGFQTSTTPICQMNGTYNQVITTFVWPDNRTIECQNINKTLNTGESLKIIGIFNPSFAGTFGNSASGFKLEVLQQTTSVVLEQITILNTVTIVAGTLTGSISQANNFINGDVVYTFYLNLLNSLSANNFILISFSNSWILYNNRCSVISGITMPAVGQLNCTNSTTNTNTILNVSNFLSASVSNQLVFSIMVRSPGTPGTYTVNIRTANTNGTVDSMSTTVFLNATYGDYSMLSINAFVAPSNVPVSGTGPLELTFFLNYQLPQTNVLTYGKFVIYIYPQIPLPPPLVNGVLKCYFFNVIPAQTCVWDTTTSASYTLLTINTPLTSAYQYSEIPITVTTEGAVNSSKIGITIADIVTRYRFEMQAYTQANAVIPTEVYFSEYIAAPILLPITYYSLSKEINEYTHLRFEFTSPYNFTSPLADDLRIKIEFLAGGAWASNLGYAANTIYKNFPCVFSDNKVQTLPPQYNSKVSCDLYTYLTGPHASLTNSTSRGPYILVSGFSNWMFINAQVRLELGKFLIGSSTNLGAYIRFSLVQETPTMLTKYVQLYYNQFKAFTTATQSIVNAGTGVLTDVITNAQINAVSNHRITYTAPSTFFAVMYQFDKISTPSFTNQFVECTIGTSPAINWCTYLGYPSNYIVEYSYLGTFTTSVSSVLNFTNGVYSGTFTATAQLYSSASLTIYKQDFNVVYTPYAIPSGNAGFWLDTGSIGYLYKGSDQYYYVDFYPTYSTPNDGFIRLIFGSGVQLGQTTFCSSTYLVPLVTELGLVCVTESSSSLKISNIQGLVGGSFYRIRVRLASTLASSSPVSPTVTIQTHYSVTADPSIVNSITSKAMSSTTNYYTIPNQFKIANPRIGFETPRINYIGKFQMVFNPSGDVLSAFQIKLILNNHAWNGGYWSTPNQAATDPLVCLINYVRVGCTYTLSPLTVTMNVSPAGITNGQNNIITLDTEYLTYNGIKHPSEGGEYNCYLQFLTNSNTVIQQQSYYHRVRPNKLANFRVSSTCTDVGAENMFIVSFRVNSPQFNAYNHATTYSRIYIEFPTVDANGNTLFAKDLGGYANTGDIVGCAFNTWDSYYVTYNSGTRLMCRLIMSEVPGQPTRVEIINHNAFTGSNYLMQVWIAKVFNPAIAVTSVPISIKIDHVVVASNDVYELYYDTYDLFMNSQNPAPSYSVVEGCQSGTGCSSCTIFSSNINNRNWLRFSPYIAGSPSVSLGYYYVIDTTSVFKPNTLQSQWNNNYCHGSYYNYCLAFPDINYFVISVASSSRYYVQLYLTAGGAISQTTTNLVSKLWYNQRYLGTHTIQLTTTCWNQLIGSFSSVSIASTAANGRDLYKNKRRAQIAISFTTSYYIPATGTVLISFPSSVPRVYPHCRSMTNLGSALYAQGTSYNGEVGCLVQNTRQWAITGFNALNGGSAIKIVGYIDFPSSYHYLGAGEIITFNNTHATNIRSNGFIIDYLYDSNFNIYIQDAPSQNVDGQVVMEETLPMRINYVGPLRFKFTLPSNLNGPNAGIITVRVPQVSTMGVAGGFSYVSAKKHVCQIIQISTYEETGCYITSIATDSTPAFPNFIFTMKTSSQLAASTSYKMIITTATGSQPEGLTFPTTAGTYKVDFNYDTTGSTGLAIHNHLYLEVYGTKFSYLNVRSFCTTPGYKNIIWVQLTPTTTIQTAQQIVIEVPTIAANGNTLFANNLGTAYTDGQSIPYDSLNNQFSQTFMTCRIFHGNQANYKPGKIVCGNFQSTITSGQILWFAISLGNPSSIPGAQVSIPFFIYSQEQGTTVRTNFDVIENAVFLRSDAYVYSDVGWVRSQNQQLQTSSVYIEMITRNVWNVVSGEYYVIFFNFPIRNNGVFSGACTYPGSSTYGDAYYHQNLWVIICAVNSATIGVPAGGGTTRNLRITNFYTPFYYLSPSEQAMTIYAHHFNSKITSISTLSDGYPNESPKTTTTSSLTFTPLHQSTWYGGTRDDYIISFTYSSSATVDVSFTQLIAFIFPTSSVDYTFPESDCLEEASSQIEIASCYIDTANGIIWITPVVKSTYTSNMAVSIITRGLAIRNPYSTLSLNKNNFQVNYYSWQNISKPSPNPRSNNQYCFLTITNFIAGAISYNTYPSVYQIPTFKYIQYPHQRYYQETPFNTLVHRAPFEMEFSPTVTFAAQSGVNYNMIKIVYPASFSDTAMVKIRDLQVFRPVCYLNNQRIKNCAIDVANNNMVMSFLFGLTANTKYHLKFSILDSRNADIDGFLSSAAVSNFVLMYKPYAGSWYYTESDNFPSLYSLPSGAATGPFRGIIAGTPTYGHTAPSNLNFVNLLLTFNRTDITGLVFEIPSVDNNGNALFSSQANLITTFMSQSNGGSYPCGNNGYSAGGSVRCIIFLGDYSNAGIPTRIVMTGFTYQTQMNCRFAFINPSTTSVYFSVNVKAFGGTSSALNPYGNQYMGFWQFNEIFMVAAGPTVYSTSYTTNQYTCPNQSPWRNSTTFNVVSRDQQINSARSSIASIKLYDSSSSTSDKLFCVATKGSAQNYDDLLQYTLTSGGVTTQYAYFIRTWASNANVSHTTNAGWGLTFLKCKYYAGLTISANFFFADNVIEVATQTFSTSYCNSYTSGVSSPISKYFSQSYFVADGTDTDLVQQFDITPSLNSITNFGFTTGDAMVLAISYDANPWGTILSCSILGGVISTSINQRAFCNVGSNTKIYIVNVGGFVADPQLALTTAYRIKIRFTSSGLTNTPNNNDFNFFIQLYANLDAYQNGYQPIIYRYNSIAGYSPLCYYSTPSACYISQSGGELGAFQVQALSDTFLRVAFSPYTLLDYSTNTGHGHHFVITTNGFNFGPSCTISNVIYEFSNSATAGSGTNNTLPISGSSNCNSNRIYITYSGQLFSSYWGGNGAASNNRWNVGQYIILYITISPDPTNRDLSTFHHQHIFIQGSYSYSWSGTYYPTTQKAVTFTSQALASSVTLSTLSNNVGGTTELSFQLTSSNIDFGPAITGYSLLVEFLSTSGWTGGSDPFGTYTNTALLNDNIACMCIAGASPLTISAASPIVPASCTRRMPNGTVTNYAILINANVQKTQDLVCFFPEFKIPSSSSISAEFKVIYGDTFPPELTTVSTKYSSLYRTTSNTLTFGTTPTMTISSLSGLTETPNFYSSATTVGSSFTGSYSLTGTWSGSLSSPYIYINFLSAGPIPITNFCSNLNVFLQCRVYTNYLYLVVAQLKSTSVTSFTLSNSGAALLYPPSQTSLSNYGANVYVGVGTWQYSGSVSRSQSNLAPISTTGIFNVYPDQYGSIKSSFQTNLYFSFNPSGQYLYNSIQTGSKLVISWSGITTTTNCQVWVQNQLAVNLVCAATSTSITITSPYFDYTTSNNIIVTIGVTNPTTPTTFNLNLYNYYYSGSRYSLTISGSTVYTTDTTYNANNLVAKSTVSLYPFASRISTVANAPLRIRFALSTSSVANANGRLTFINSQIAYSSAHLCYIIAYNSYASMMQQTQRNIFKVDSCTSSSTTLTVIPPNTLTLSASSYYELVIMPLNINAAGCTALGCVTQSGYQQTNWDLVTFIAYNSFSTGPINQQTNRLYAYEGSSFIGLQHIYVLCTQPTITSIYLSININFTSSNNYPAHYLEITLYDLSISAFTGYSIGSIFPCQLSTNFLSIGSRNQPQCRIVSADLLNSFVTVRIENIGALSPQIYWISLDDITLPTPTSSDNNNKFDINIAYFGPSNTKYSNFFPEIFQIDNTNSTAPVTSTSFTFSNPALTGFGNAIVGQVAFNWPFTSSSSTYENKIAINWNGGYSAVWSDINSVTYLDATVGTYQILWVNTKLNKFVFLMPNKSSGVSTTLNINALTNPYPYQQSLYVNNGTNVIINFYNNHFLANKQTFAQPSYAIFTMNPSLIYINQNFPCNTIDNYPATNTFAPGALHMLYLSVSFDETAANIISRNLGIIQIKFTSGVNYIRECRAMRNTSLYFNPTQVCQHYTDGTSWYVQLYDVTNSQVTTGWWIQVFATFNSATLAYTSYVMAANNNIVEFQSSYTNTMAGYNATRSIPTKLSWLNNKYVANFHETQYKYLQAISGQTTQYIKFRFTAPITSSGSSDMYYIYLPDNNAGQAFSPVNSGSNMIAQFLPAMSAGDSDFSVGAFAQCTLVNSGGIFYHSCQMRYGGLTAGGDYLVQISEYNTATSSFYMPTSPGRQQIQFMYQYIPSNHNWQYFQSTNVFFYRFFRSAQFLHTTTTVNDYETITINYTPYGSLSAFASNNEIALRLSVEARYHSADGGITAIYTADSKTLLSGNQYSGVVSNPNSGEIYSIQFAQYSIENAPLRFTLAKQSAYTDNTAYYWIVPLLQNPGTAYISLRYNLTLVNSPASSYEYIFNHYQSINEYFTVSDTSTNLATSINNNVRAVQTVSNVDLSVNLGSLSLNQWDTTIFKINNALPGLLPSLASPNDTSNYNYYYFALINMIMAQKKSLSTVTTVGIGAASSSLNYQSTFALSWVKVFDNSNAPQTTNPYTLYYSTPAALTLTHLTSYSASSVTLVEGYQSQGSSAMYKVTFTTPIIPVGGEIRILFNNNYFTSFNNAQCRVNTNYVRSSSAADVLRCYRVSQGFRIAGFAAITASTSISAYIMLKSTATATSIPLQVDIFGKYLDNTTRIALAQVGTITHTSGTVPSALYRLEQTVAPYFSTIHTNNFYFIEGSLNLRSASLLNGDYIYISQPGWSSNGGNRRLIVKQNLSSVTGWTELVGAYISSNYYRFTLPQNYLMTQTIATSVQYVFRYYILDSIPNGFIAGGVGVSRFWITTQSSGTYYEVGYSEVIPYAQPNVLTIKNRYTAAGKQTVLDLYWTSNVDINSGESLVVSFDTNNLLYQMFANDIENAGTNGATYRYLDCRQWYTNSYISNSRLVCILNFGNSQANPPTPANLTITFTKYCSGFYTYPVIRILIANVMNPTTVGLNTGVKVNVMVPCESQQNQPCSSYEARGFYVTASSTQNALSTSTSFSSSSPLVLTTGLTHTFTLTLTASIGVNDAIYIVYPENFQGVMPSDCAVTNYYCYVFPTRRWVVLYPTTTIGAGAITLSITSMNNPYYAQAYSQYFLVTVARSASSVIGDTYKILQGAFTPVSYSFQNTSVSTVLAVATTQTPNMYLRNYANTVIFTISNIFSDSRMKAIYIQAPADVTSWDPTYCNASITTTANFNYPLRFTCIVDPNTPQFLRLTLDADMPAFNTAWGLLNIRVHAKFTLADFPVAPTLYVTTATTSGSFYVYSSTNATTSSSLYYMSQCSTTVSISANQVPIISVVNFNTKSFANRQATVNSKEVFYLLFKPLVSATIGSIVFTIPSQFNYPGVFQFDNCLMIGRTTIPQPNCQLSRSQGQTLVTIVPTNYDNQVKIIQIGTVSSTNWFTAPSLPGDFYNMNVAIYSPAGALIAKQTRNISPVYGSSFDIPTMTIQNVQDTDSKLAVYDISFVTGSLQIPPGALTTATSQTSALVFIFENFNGMNPTNIFSNDLKTGLNTGDEVGCKVFAGLTALPGMRIKCILTVGANSTFKPTIRIINYNFINPATTITIGFAGIQSLPTVLVNTISIGVVIYYNDIGSSTYLYVPTPILTVPTNATNMFNSMPSGWVSGWGVNASYSSTNIVLKPTSFTVSISIPYWYWQNQFGSWLYNYQYSSTGANDQFVLLTFYPPTLLDKNNPVAVTCASCTSVDVYYASGTVRFRHNTVTSGSGTRAFQFNNFPTSAYSMLNQTVYVYFQVFQSYQAVFQRNVTVNLSRTVEKCTLFNFGVISVSSLNGGEIGVTYLFSIKTNHFVPANGALSITIPSVYGDMVANAATCTLVGFNNTNCYCKINTPYRVDIYANGTQLSSSTTYSIRLTGLQNPNVDSSNFVFIVTSYYVSNIYLGLIICQNQIVPPAINIKPLRTCTLSWTPQYYNQNFNTTYTFQLSCSDVFRGDSILYIALPSAFGNNRLGNYSCSSYESTTLIAPVCTLQNINSVLTITTSIDASSQSSLSLILNLVNPINNTYSASAYVKSKGTQYASSTNSSLTILSNSYASAQSSHVQLLNLPKEAGLMSTYVFRIAPISTFAPSNLGITFPDNFYIDSTKISVAIYLNAQNNIFSLLNYNNMQSLLNNASTLAGTRISSYPTTSVVGTSVYLTGIASQVNSKLWTYVFISNIQNPSAYVYKNFTVAYYLISNGFQALQWVFQNPLTYYISAAPKYISIDSVTVSDLDLLFPATYTFKITGANGANIGIQGKTISYIIVIPTFYKNTLWANNPPTCKFSVLASASSCTNSNGEIIVTQAFSANYSSLTLTVTSLLNPSLPTSCNTTDTTILAQTFFVIRIIDTVSNSFLFESSSVVDSTNCLTFTALRIPISLEYSLIMSAGLAYNITYGLSKPSTNLKIAAYMNNSAFTFSPQTVDFNDFYTLTKTTQLFLRSDIPAGSYVIYFTKSEASNQTSYRNILPVTITVTASNGSTLANTPTISIPSMTDSTVGYPVVIPIRFSLPSSTEMTLFMSVAEEANQTLTQYSSALSNFTITPKIINILPQQTLYNYTVTLGSRIVPPPLTLNFKLTSNYPIVHNLTTPTMYLCFDRDPKNNVLYPPLRVTVTQFLTSCNQQDVGKQVTNIFISNDASQSSAASVTPKIIGMSVSSVASTGAVILVNSITAGTIFFACLPAGSAAVTDPKLLISGNVTNGITGSAQSSALNIQSGKTAQINFVAYGTVSKLAQSSNYVFYAVSRSNLGTSPIASISFSTTVISKGVQFKMSFSAVVDNLALVTALVQSLRVSPGRIKILTSLYTLNQQAQSVNSNSNRPTFVYDIVLAPDQSNDIVSPYTTISTFASSNSSLLSFQVSVPSFIITTPIKYYEIRPIQPQLKRENSFKVNSIRNYNASFSIYFKSQSNIYAILIESIGTASNNLNISKVSIVPVTVASLSASEKAVAPSSSQIQAGTDHQNTPLGKYKVVQTTTDTNGAGTIVFSDLKENSAYKVYVTASSPLPYSPTMLWPDPKVLTFNFSTIPNPNVGSQAKQLEYVKQLEAINPDLAREMRYQISINQRKSSTKNDK